jgi:hypothetical protein
MKLRISDSTLLPDLIDWLVGQGALVAQIGPNELEVALMASYNSAALRAELARQVEDWQAESLRVGRTASVQVGDSSGPVGFSQSVPDVA